MKNEEPIITKTITADGWVVTADYGKQGVSTGYAHIAQGTPEEADANRRELNRVLGQFGYRLEEITIDR